jgi:hypothetical protein
MDDDERLVALFREAAGDPPPGFDHRAVVTRSRRVTARRRAAVLGSAAALVVVLGTGVVVTGQAQRDAASTAAAGSDADAGASAERESAEEGSAEAGSAQDGGPQEGSAEPGSAVEAPFAATGPVLPAPTPGPPLGPGTTPCVDRQDPALRALLARVLPEVVGAPEAALTEECRAGGAREVSLEVVDGTASGRLTVASLPAGAPPLQAQEAAVATAPTASGGTVVVRSQGDGPGAPAPFAGRLDAVAAALAPAL